MRFSLADPPSSPWGSWYIPTWKVHTMLMSKHTEAGRSSVSLCLIIPTCLCVNTRQSGYIYTSDNMQWSFGLTRNRKVLQKPAVRDELPCVLGGVGGREEPAGRTSFLERCVWKAAGLSLVESLMGAQGWLMSLGGCSLCWGDGQAQVKADWRSSNDAEAMTTRQGPNTHTHTHTQF